MGILDAMVPLGSVTLTAAQATVNFTSIDGSYRDLRLVAHMRNGNAGNGVAALRYNSDTASNYTNVGMYAEATSAYGAYTNTVSYQYLSSTALQTDPTVAIIDIMDYSTNKQKTLIGKTGISGSGASNVMGVSSRWASTAAITSLNIFINGTAQFAAGDTFDLFGVRA